MRHFFFSFCIWVLIASGSFLTVCGVLDYWESRNGQRQIAREWQQDQGTQSADPLLTHQAARNAPSQPSNSSASIPRRGDAVAKLTIPRLKTVLYIVEGTDDRDLKRGPGHLSGTVLPGEDGNCVIAGHRDTHFRVLKDLHDGDELILERGGREFRYRVGEMSIVSPDNTASLRPSRKPILNLITCYPFEYVGSAPKRMVVHADLEGSSLRASR